MRGLRWTNTEQVLQLTLAELSRLKSETVSEAELKRAKDQLKSNIVLGLESSGSRMSNLARQQMYFGRFFGVDEITADIDRVSVFDVQRLAGELFRPEAIALTLLGNLEVHEGVTRRSGLLRDVLLESPLRLRMRRNGSGELHEDLEEGWAAGRRGFHADRAADRDVGDADPDDAGYSAAVEVEEAGEPDVGDSVAADDRAGGAAVQLDVSGERVCVHAFGAWRAARVGSSDLAERADDSAGSGGGQKAGYTFSISNCTKVTVNNQDMFTSYQVKAVPQSPGKTGDLGFCTDENNLIKSTRGRNELHAAAAVMRRLPWLLLSVLALPCFCVGLGAQGPRPVRARPLF